MRGSGEDGTASANPCTKAGTGKEDVAEVVEGAADVDFEQRM